MGFEQGLDRLVALGSVLDRKKLEGFYHFRHFAPNLGTAYIHFSVLCHGQGKIFFAIFISC